MLTENKLRVVLVGIGGFASNYVTALLDGRVEPCWQLVGVVDPLAERARYYPQLKALQLPFYDSLDDFYAEQTADLAIVSTPIQLHCQQACTAMERGTHVLCEKPVCAVIQDALKMDRVSRETGRFCAIGYQWCYHEAILALKRDLLAGIYGAPKRFRSLVLWPRTSTYYHRNSWAGGLKTQQGEWILDSPVNNAAAHYLHNMLFLLGRELRISAEPVTVQAELYRANAIGNYDTAALRIETMDQAEILFYASHAISVLRGPEFILDCQEGRITYDIATHRMTGVTRDGQVIQYGEPDQGVERKLNAALKAALGDREALICDVQTAMKQTLCMNLAQVSVGQVTPFPNREIYYRGPAEDSLTIMTGLAEDLVTAYDAGRLPGEVRPHPWSRMGRVVPAAGFVSYPAP